jgi:hypothetical protein
MLKSTALYWKPNRHLLPASWPPQLQYYSNSSITLQALGHQIHTSELLSKGEERVALG